MSLRYVSFAGLGKLDKFTRDRGEKAMATEWPRRAEFINLILAYGVAKGSVKLDDVEFDGVAGENFRQVIEAAFEGEAAVKDDLIKIALKTGVPVEGLEADGEFGAKWVVVVNLGIELSPPETFFFNTRPMSRRQRG